MFLLKICNEHTKIPHKYRKDMDSNTTIHGLGSVGIYLGCSRYRGIYLIVFNLGTATRIANAEVSESRSFILVVVQDHTC